MKKTFFTLVLVSLLFACQKTVSETNELSRDTIAMLKAENLLDLRQRYRMLSNNEKQTLWETKYAYILQHNQLSLDEEQILIIKKFQKLLIENPIGSGRGFIADAYLMENLDFIRKNFTDPQLFLLIECPFFKEDFDVRFAESYIQQLSSRNTKRLSGVEEPGGDVGLESKCTCLYSISCWSHNGGTTYCKTQICAQIRDCGFWGDSNCTGRCE